MSSGRNTNGQKPFGIIRIKHCLGTVVRIPASQFGYVPNDVDVFSHCCVCLHMENDLILVCDQAFQDHIFDGIEFVHPATLPGMWERTLTVCSISKGIGLSGFRIGYIYADDVIMDTLYGGAVNVLGAPCTLSSIGAIAAIKDHAHLAENHARLDRRRRMAYEAFHDIPGVEMRMSESGILSWLNVSRLGTDEAVADRIREQARILVNQGTPYGQQGKGHIRIVTGCFASDEDAAERFARIRQALLSMSPR